MDGRHFFQRQPGILQGPHRKHRHAISVPLCHCPLPHVRHVVLAGSNGAHTLSAGHRPWHTSVGSHRHVPRSQRLLLPAQLSHDGGSHQLRPHRLNGHRSLLDRPLVPIGRFHNDSRIDWRWLSDYPVFIILNIFPVFLQEYWRSHLFCLFYHNLSSHRSVIPRISQYSFV